MTLPKIQYLKGDATTPCLKQGVGNYILHICNDVGAWGAGFVLSLNRTFGSNISKIYKEQIQKLKAEGTNPLGNISIVDVSGDREENDTTRLYVVNMIAQRDIKPTADSAISIPLVRYESLVKCLEKAKKEIAPGSRIHFPLFGAGLGGGDWNIIQYLVRAILIDHDCFGYIFPSDTENFYLLEECQSD